MNGLLRAGGALCAIVCLVGVASLLAGSARARFTEIQLGTDTARVDRLLSDRERRESVSRALTIDYGFLAAYWAAFTILAVVIIRRGGAWVAVDIAALAAAGATASLDIVENLRTQAVLTVGDEGRQLTQSQLDGLRHVSLAKWAASALTLALLAGVFMQRRWVVAIGVALMALAIVGLLGLHWHRLINPYLVGVAVITLFIAVPCLGWPEVVGRGLR
jgi:hypothetical protein